jgi:hypothetical protein
MEDAHKKSSTGFVGPIRRRRWLSPGGEGQVGRADLNERVGCDRCRRHASLAGSHRDVERDPVPQRRRPAPGQLLCG